MTSNTPRFVIEPFYSDEKIAWFCDIKKNDEPLDPIGPFFTEEEAVQGGKEEVQALLESMILETLGMTT